jgi:hypothetical protein
MYSTYKVFYANNFNYKRASLVSEVNLTLYSYCA